MSDAATCTSCAAFVPVGSTWCEACGASVSHATTPTPRTPHRPAASVPSAGAPEPSAAVWLAPCVACNAASAEVSADGWCTICGQRQPTQQDHAEFDAGRVAAVTDRGLRHHRNEDAVAVAERHGGALLVVCDGVSSTELPDAGAQAACQAALDVLVTHWDERYPSASDNRSGVDNSAGTSTSSGADRSAGTSTSSGADRSAGTPSDPTAEPGDFDGLAPWMEAATQAANDAVATVIASAGELRGEPPSCTMVAAAARINNDQVTIWIGWLGDSRAYWVSGLDGQLLTLDHSWAAMQDEYGTLDADEIAADPRANSITRWVGPDSPNNRAEVRRFDFATPGRLIVCTDGLWRYADSAADMALRSAEAGDVPLEAARNLADLALTSGGHDNISVAVFDAGVVKVLEATPATKE